MNRIQQFLDEATDIELQQANSLIVARLQSAGKPRQILKEKRLLLRAIRKMNRVIDSHELSADAVERYLNLVNCMLLLMEKEVGERSADT